MEIKKLIGKKIQKIRKEKGLTQEKLAELIKIEVPSLSNIETGKFLPSIETLQKLSKILDIKLWEFYYFEDTSIEEMKEEIIKTINKNQKALKLFYNLIKNLDF